jgi:hypothetical protein
MRALVCVELDAAELTASGAVVAPLWLEIGDVKFPEVGWYDFPVPVLGWWIEALRELVSSTSDEATLRFMDGPFEVRLTRSGALATAAFLRRERGHGPEAMIDPRELLASVTARARALVSALERQGLSSSQLGRLKELGSDPGRRD